MISYINLSPEGITIHGDKIDINGALTLSNWADSSDYTKISGGFIATRTISVDKVTPNFGQDLDISANTAINLRVTKEEFFDAVADINIGGRNVAANTGYRLEGTKKVGNEEVPDGIATSVFSTQAQRVNLLPNPSFESGLGTTGWSAGDGDITVYGTTGNGFRQTAVGNRCVMQTSAGTTQYMDTWSDTLDLPEASRVVTAGAHVWCDDTATVRGVRLAFRFYNASGAAVSGTVSGPTESKAPWIEQGKRITTTAAVPATATKVMLYLRTMGDGVYVPSGHRTWWDAVTLESGETDGSWFTGQRVNLLPNPSFEDGSTTGWQGSTWNTIANYGMSSSWYTSPHAFGTKSLQTTTNGTGTTTAARVNRIPASRIPVMPNTEYTVGASTWIDQYTAGEEPENRVTLVFFDSAGTQLPQNYSTPRTKARYYTGDRITVTGGSPENAATVDIRLETLTGTTAVPAGKRSWWDAITFEEGVTDGSWFESDQPYVAPFIDDNEIYNGNRSLRVQASVPGSSMQNIGHQIYDGLELNEDVSLSFFVKGTAGKGNVDIVGSATSGGTKQFDVTSSWTKVVLPLGKLTSKLATDESSLSFWFQNAGVYWLNSIKLESGNKHTRWTPAPEDNDSEFRLLVERVKTAELAINPDSIAATVISSNTYVDHLSPITDRLDGIDGEDGSIKTIERKIGTFVLKDDIAEFGFVTQKEIDDSITDRAGGVIENIKTNFSFEPIVKDVNGTSISGGLTIGTSESDFKTNITDQKLSFKNGATDVAWISGTSMYIENAEVVKTLRIGKHIISSESTATVFRNA